MAPRSPLRSVRLRGPPSAAARRAGLLTLELRLPLAEECADPLLRVFGLERCGKALCLRLQALVDVAVRGHLLDLLDRDRRLTRELARPGQRRVEQLVVGDDLVDE